MDTSPRRERGPSLIKRLVTARKNLNGDLETMSFDLFESVDAVEQRQKALEEREAPASAEGVSLTKLLLVSIFHYRNSSIVRQATTCHEHPPSRTDERASHHECMSPSSGPFAARPHDHATLSCSAQISTRPPLASGNEQAERMREAIAKRGAKKRTSRLLMQW